MNKTWKDYLAELEWVYWKQCQICGTKKLYYKRGTEVMTVTPSRNHYQFTENGKIKAGKLDKLSEVVKAAKNQA